MKEILLKVAEEVKREALDLIRRTLGPLDLVIYSIAAPRRLDPTTGTLHSSVIKPIGAPYTARTVDFQIPIPGGLPDDPVLRALDFLTRYRDMVRLTAATRRNRPISVNNAFFINDFENLFTRRT